MAISKKDVEHVALLSRLDLTEEEKHLYGEQLSAILAFMGKLQELNTDDISPTAHILPLQNVLRKDMPRPSIDQGEALQNAPLQEKGMFRVPRIV
ncbi:MAG: Asp-tRNA(Asn)/Glu-tRNA(Gln) amidotransferase subunit GatC [Bacillota bacterium]|jgi:aspartyl-tRNA(Asn)/glutamyl-tRNA(Gln) amidotransferase subunit C